MARSNQQFISRDQAKKPYFIGVDLGGTNIKAGVVDDLGRPLAWLSIPTDVPRGRKTPHCRWARLSCRSPEKQARIFPISAG